MEPESPVRLRHIAQAGLSQPFTTYTDSVTEAYQISEELALYDLHLLEEGLREDFSNYSWIEVWDTDEQDWMELDHEEVKQWMEEEKRSV